MVTPSVQWWEELFQERGEGKVTEKQKGDSWLKAVGGNLSRKELLFGMAKLEAKKEVTGIDLRF